MLQPTRPDDAPRFQVIPAGDEPAVRLARLKEDLSALDGLEAARARVLARLRPQTLAVIEDGTRVSWVPVAVKAEVAEAVFAEVGAAGTRAWGKASFHASLSSFFRPLIQGVVAVFGMSPATLLKIAPQSWQAVYRNAGELAVRRDGDHRSRILARGLPSALRSDAYLNLLAGTFEAGLELCGREGEVRWERGGERADDVTYSITWKAQ